MASVKTTIDIPDELFKKAKATAAMQGESLKDLICDAIEARLAAVPPQHSDRSGWWSLFGVVDPKTVAKVDRVIEAELERIDPSEWR